MRLSAAGVLACLAAPIACKSAPDPASATSAAARPVPIRTFADVFRPHDSLQLSAAGVTPVTSIHSMDVSKNGDMLVTDQRSHDVKVISSDGRHIEVVGRLGSGPGEFRLPWDARYFPDGGFAVSDPELERITLFGPDLKYRGSFTTPGQDPRLVLPARDSTLIVAGLADVGHTNRVLARYRRDGTRVGTYLHADTLVFKIELVADGPWLAEASDGGVFAGLAVVPTVTRLSPTWQTLGSTSMAPPGWVQLAPRTQPARSLRDIREWLLASSLAGPALTLGDGRLYLAFQRTTGDSTVYSFAVYSPAGQLQEVLTDVPGRPLTGHGESLFLVDDDLDGVTIVKRFDALPHGAAGQLHATGSRTGP